MVYSYKIAKRRNNLSTTSILILINVVLFILFSLLILVNETFLNYIALKPSNILQGKSIWTFLTSMFMHAGLFHIFANMVTLFFMGKLTEKILGKKRYVWFYLIAGIFSGLFFVLISYIFGIDLNTFAVGASGALFGLVGFLMLMTPNLPVFVMFIPIPVKMKYAAPGILVLLWLISIAGNVPIGNTAHLGGLLVGVFYALYLKKKYRRKTERIKRNFS